MFGMFNSIMYCYLQFVSVDYALEPKIAELLVDSLSSSSECDIFQNRTLCEAKQCIIYKCILLHFSPYVQHTLHTVLQGTSFFLSHQQQFFSSLCVLKSPESLPGGSSFGPLGVVCFSGIWRSSEFDLAVIWTSDIQDLATACGKFFTLLFCL